MGVATAFFAATIGFSIGASLNVDGASSAQVAHVISGSQLAEFFIASITIIMVPGPSVLFTLARGVAWGRAVAVLDGARQLDRHVDPLDHRRRRTRAVAQ